MPLDEMSSIPYENKTFVDFPCYKVESWASSCSEQREQYVCILHVVTSSLKADCLFRKESLSLGACQAMQTAGEHTKGRLEGSAVEAAS